MRLRSLSPGLAILVLVIAGCGSSNASHPASVRSSGGTAGATRAPLRIFRVKLTGGSQTPPGAPNGVGAAVIAIHRGSVVCWRFAHLHGFSDATQAQINTGASGRSGAVLVPLSTGPRLRHRGCVRATAAAVHAIDRDPAGHYLTIASAQYPAGAVRAEL